MEKTSMSAGVDNEKNIALAVHYYNSMIAKNFEEVSNCLHENVQFIAPFGDMKGKEAVLRGAKEFYERLSDDDKFHIRAKFANGSQVMLAYDFYFHSFQFTLHAAVLLDFEEGKIIRSEMFCDNSAFKGCR